MSKKIEDLFLKIELFKKILESKVVSSLHRFKMDESDYYELPIVYQMDNASNFIARQIDNLDNIAQQLEIEDEFEAVLERGYLEIHKDKVFAQQHFFEVEKLRNIYGYIVLDKLIQSKIADLIKESLFLEEVRECIDVTLQENKDYDYDKGIIVKINYKSLPNVFGPVLFRQLDFLSQIPSVQGSLVFSNLGKDYLRIHFTGNVLEAMHADAKRKK